MGGINNNQTQRIFQGSGNFGNRLRIHKRLCTVGNDRQSKRDLKIKASRHNYHRNMKLHFQYITQTTLLLSHGIVHKNKSIYFYKIQYEKAIHHFSYHPVAFSIYI